nr:hypothetical protein BaRGS_018211 [Batillaria attramentaria]
MSIATLSLSMPLARVETEYTDSLKTTFEFISTTFQQQFEEHLGIFYALLNTNFCGGKDFTDLRHEIDKSKKAAAALTVDALRRHCDDMDWETVLEKDDKYCKNYLAAKKYFNNETPYNTTIHNANIKDVKDSKQKQYLDKIIRDDRSKQLATIKDDNTTVPDHTDGMHEHCLVAVCIVSENLLAAVSIPFIGIGAAIFLLLVGALKAYMKLVLKIAQLERMYLNFKVQVEIAISKLQFFHQEPTNVHFSLANFNLIYLAYPALLTGCVGILAGFWHRRGTALTRRYRATLAVVFPLLVVNIFGLGFTMAWAEILAQIGQFAPLIKLTVTPLAAVEGLKAAYACSITACIIFLSLAFWEKRNIKIMQIPGSSPGSNVSAISRRIESLNVTTRQDKTGQDKTGQDKTGQDKTGQDRSIESLNVTTESIQAREKPKRETSAARDMARYRGHGARPTTFTLAVVMALAASGIVSVIMWNPVYVFDFDADSNMTTIMDELGDSVAETQVAKRLLIDTVLERCEVVESLVKRLVKNYFRSLVRLNVTFLSQTLHDVKVNAKTSVKPVIQILHVPILLTVYVPTALILWSAIASRFFPLYALAPRSLGRLASTLSMISIGWIANGILFLISVASSGAIPILAVSVQTGGGFAFAMAAIAVMMFVAQELRVGALSPLL